MKEEIKEILSGKGLGIIKFGMTRNEVIDILGEPNEKEKDFEATGKQVETETFHYDSCEASFTFLRTLGWKLNSIAISSAECEFMGKKLIGLNEEELTIELANIGLEDLEFEDVEQENEEDEEQVIIYSKQVSTWFWLIEDELTEIIWEAI